MPKIIIIKCLDESDFEDSSQLR